MPEISFSSSRRFHQSDSAALTELAGNALKDLSDMTPLPRDRLSRAEERRATWQNTFKKKFGARPSGVTPSTPGADSANTQDVQDKTSGATDE